MCDLNVFFFLHTINRAKFDLDIAPVESETHLRIRQMSLDLSSPNHIPLNVRIAEFCEDPQNMDEMTAFVDDILKKAQIEADAQLELRNKVLSINPVSSTIVLLLESLLIEIILYLSRLTREMEKVTNGFLLLSILSAITFPLWYSFVKTKQKINNLVQFLRYIVRIAHAKCSSEHRKAKLITIDKMFVSAVCKVCNHLLVMMCAWKRWVFFSCRRCSMSWTIIIYLIKEPFRFK